MPEQGGGGLSADSLRENLDRVQRHPQGFGLWRTVVAERDEWKARFRALKQDDDQLGTDYAKALIEADRLRKALLSVKEHAFGKVCAQFEVCTHPSCSASYNAWAIADEALSDPAAPLASEPSTAPSGPEEAC